MQVENKTTLIEKLLQLRTPVERLPGRGRWRLDASVSALAFLAASVLCWVQMAHGERTLQRLPDGSELRLDTDSRVTVRYRRPDRVGVLGVGTRFDICQHHRMTTATVGSAEPVHADARPAIAWSEHKIVFKHRALGEVAAEFNRYGSIPVDIEDAALRALPVSGMLDAGDTESFVAFLKTLPGVKVERTPTRVRVVKVTPTT